MLNKAEYDCKFGPDAAGQFVEEVVTSSQALNCGSFCQCVGHSDNTCLFGPDANGFFFTDSAVQSEQVDSCSQDWCICDKHIEVIKQMAAADNLTFADVANQRISQVDNAQVINGQTGEISTEMPISAQEPVTDPEQQAESEQEPATDTVAPVEPETEPVTPIPEQPEQEGSKTTLFLASIMIFIIVVVILLLALRYLKKRMDSRDKGKKMEEERKKYLKQDIEASPIQLKEEEAKEMQGSRLNTDPNSVSNIVQSERKLLEGEEEKTNRNNQEIKIFMIDPQEIELQFRRPQNADNQLLQPISSDEQLLTEQISKQKQRNGSWRMPLDDVRQQPTILDTQQNEESGRDSVPDMESFISSDINDEEMNAQLERVQILKNDKDEMSPIKRQQSIYRPPEDPAEEQNSENQICKMLPTDPGLIQEQRQIIQPSVSLIDQSDNVSHHASQKIIEQSANRLVSEGDEVKFDHSSSAQRLKDKEVNASQAQMVANQELEVVQEQVLIEDTPNEKGKGTIFSSVDGEEPRRGRTEPEAPAEIQQEDSIGVESEPEEMQPQSDKSAQQSFNELAQEK